ncbi:hypothetical protein B5M44_20565 [Shinella sumterensis]|nr:hypothetical protein B5M44_20565 [Shinella sumterensis]
MLACGLGNSSTFIADIAGSRTHGRARSVYSLPCTLTDRFVSLGATLPKILLEGCDFFTKSGNLGLNVIACHYGLLLSNETRTVGA